MAELTDYQRDILTRTALGEAGGKGPDAMADVVQVVLNRTRSPRFPNDPAEVALQNKQFSTWNKGEGGNNPQRFSTNSKAYQTAAQVVDLVASGKAPDMTGGALDYHASNISPYWADSKKGQYGTIERNGHTFYPTHPVPPGELPSVASLLSVYQEAPAPVTPTIDMAQMRRTAPPSRLVADSFAALPPARQGLNSGDSLALKPVVANFPQAGEWDGGYSPSKGAVTLNSNPRDIALPRPRPVVQQSASDLARGQSPMNSLTVGGRTPIGLVSPGNLDLNRRTAMNDGQGGIRTENSISIGTDQGEILIPTVVNGKQLSEREAIAHYERTGENLGTFQTPEAANRYAETLHERQGQQYAPKSASMPELPRPRPQTAPPDLISQSMAAIADANPQRIAPVPVAQSVDLRQSRLPLPNSMPIAPPALPPRVTVSTANTTPQSQIDRGAPRAVAQSPATRMVASVPVPASQSLPPLSAPPRQAIPQSFAGMEGGYTPPIAQPAGSTVATKGQERLAATPALPPALYGGVAASAVPPMPYPTIARAPVPAAPFNAVATQLDVTPPRVAPVPFPRPNFGMGGVDIPAPLTRNGVAAPTPMPRLQRGGIFGNPQIMGHDVPLPGVLGLLQGATKAMNNSSGPFNNGGDNALYNLFRGGDFNTPGAATVQGRDGYLYAPKPGGGFTNVGRANRNLSPAQTSAAANQGLFRNGGNGTGSGGSSGSSGGLNTVFDRAFGEARNYN